MLRLNNVTIEYSKLLFKDISFTLGNGEKIGLVGVNGSGKTTLLKLIAGVEQPDQGSIDLISEKVGYLPQIFDLQEDSEEDFEYLGEYLESLVGGDLHDLWKVDSILNRLSFGDYDEFERLATFSPGQKMKLYLAKLLQQEPTILLLDEPTNHLDLKGILWLEGFIRSFKGICIIISHDREFLNTVTDTIMEIDAQKIYFYKGNYDDFVEARARRLEKLAVVYELQERRREKLENLVEKMRTQPGGEAAGRRLRAAKTRLNREVLATEIVKYDDRKLQAFNIAGSVYKRKRVLEVADLHFSYSKDKPLLEGINLEMFGSEKIWLMGDNGTGKSTFIKLITGELQADKGSMRWGPGINWKYFAQDQTNLTAKETVQEYFFKQTHHAWERSFGILEKFMFDKDLSNQPVHSLSPGQKSRLNFAIFAQQHYECLILDEPTNHLDIETKEAILESLQEYEGGIILVSHDRYFAKSLMPDQILTIQERTLTIQQDALPKRKAIP